MKLVLDKEIKSLDGTPYKNGDVSLTLKEVVINVLGTQTQQESAMGGIEKMKLFELARRVFKNPKDEPIELSAEEISLLKDRIGKNYVPFVVGACYEILEGKD